MLKVKNKCLIVESLRRTGPTVENLNVPNKNKKITCICRQIDPVVKDTSLERMKINGHYVFSLSEIQKVDPTNTIGIR